MILDMNVVTRQSREVGEITLTKFLKPNHVNNANILPFQEHSLFVSKSMAQWRHFRTKLSLPVSTPRYLLYSG